MLISVNWLKELVPAAFTPERSPEKLAEALTLLGLEVTAFKAVNTPIAGLTIGEVMTKQRHANADRLALTSVKYRTADGAEETVAVVCGAPNVAAGQKIAYAPVGTLLPGGLKLKAARIRGVVSHGMICSLAELGKEAVSDTIWVLPARARIDESIEQYFGAADVLLDFDITANRSDAMSVIGVAREVATLTEKPLADVLQLPQPAAAFAKALPAVEAAAKPLQVTVEAPEAVPRYMALAFDNVTIKPSPRWLCDRLTAHEIRPINNIVDITNLILLEYGQPLHAFDAERLATAAKLVVRLAREGETLVALDGRKLTLTTDTLIIADSQQPIGLAGVIGGKESGITSGTHKVILEAACFAAGHVRQTAQRTGYLTDAAKCFIRGTVDAALTPDALMRAALLILELSGGKLAGAPVDCLQKERALPQCPVISLSPQQVKQALAIELSAAQLVQFLQRIGCAAVVSEGTDSLRVVPPSFRKDLRKPWDLLEEVARLYGYEALPVTMPRALHDAPVQTETTILARVQEYVCALGYTELVSYPFIEEAFLSAVGIAAKDVLVPSNPLLQTASVLRPTLLCGALKTLRTNAEKRHPTSGRLFECGNVFAQPQTALNAAAAVNDNARASRLASTERHVVGLLLSAGTPLPQWYTESSVVDFHTLRGAVEVLIERVLPRLRHGSVKVTAPAANARIPFLMPEEQVLLSVTETDEYCLGYCGRVRQAALSVYELAPQQPVYYAEVDLAVLAALYDAGERVRPYRTPSPYPFVTRDVALVVAKSQPLGTLLDDFKRAHEYVERVQLVEVYSGKQLTQGVTKPDASPPPERKAFVFRLYLRSAHKTLQNAEADRLVERIIVKLRHKHTFDLR